MFQIIRKKILCAKIRQVAAIRGVFIGFTNESLFFIPIIQRGVKMSKIDYQGELGFLMYCLYTPAADTGHVLIIIRAYHNLL